MIKNYLVIAWRSLLNNKLFTTINVVGLSLSMCVCMMVMLRVIDNLNYDTFHPSPDKTFRINSYISSNGNTIRLATTALPLKEKIAQESSVIYQTATLYPALKGNASDGVKTFWLNATFTSPEFFNLFGYSLKFGNPKTALQDPDNIVLSLSVAEKFFGQVNPVGRLITFESMGTFQVSGVLADPPAKSHINFDALASISSVPTLEKLGKLPTKLHVWNTFEDGYTYVRIHDERSRKDLIDILTREARALNRNSQAAIEFVPQSLSTITPGLIEMHHETSRGSSWAKLSIEITVGIIILVAASFNYTNLSVARALRRGKEVGIRKLAGARRHEIFAQYIIEAIVLALFALLLASALLSFILEFKPFNDSYEMIPDTRLGTTVLCLFFIFAVLAGIMAGFVPAWILSAFKPVRVLRGVGTQVVMGHLSFRKILTIFQFTLSIVIIIFLSAFYQQFSFVEESKSDYSKENILVIPLSGSQELLRVQLSQVAGVQDIALTSDHFGKYTSGKVNISIDRTTETSQALEYYYADAALVHMMKLELVAGSNLPPSGTDTRYALLNEKACRVLGLKKIDDALGLRLFMEDSTEVQIRGVLRDFHQRSIAHDIVPLMIMQNPERFRQMLVRVHPSFRPSAMNALEVIYNKTFPDDAYNAFWMDERINEQNSQTATISLLGFLAFMAVTIASLGLLGLVVYTVETKRKEISIRKIVGAKIVQVMMLLTRNYIQLLLISAVIALPLGYFLSEFFLMSFPNKINFGMGSLLGCVIFVFLVGMMIILPQTWKAAVQNPGENLRND